MTTDPVKEPRGASAWDSRGQNNRCPSSYEGVAGQSI